MGELVATADIVDLPCIVIGELCSAFRLGSRERENVAALATFLEQPFVRVIDVGADVARRYGALHARLRGNGTPLPINDVWIAASVMHAGTHLVTFDADFERIEGLDRTVLAVPGE